MREAVKNPRPMPAFLPPGAVRRGSAIPWASSLRLFRAVTTMLSISLLYITFIVAQIVAGVWLFVRGLRGGSGFPSCGKCGYDLSASLGSVARCPECGSAFAEVGINKPGPRKRPILLVAGGALVVIATGCLGTGLTMTMTNNARARATVAQAQAVAAQAQAQPDAQPDTTTQDAAADDQETDSESED